MATQKKPVLWKVSVAIYAARNGNYKHWALHLHREDEHHVFEVIGEHPAFVANDMEVDPSNTDKLEQDMDLTEIFENHVEDFKRVVRGTTVDNGTVHWNCQDYVLEALENLEIECIIDDEEDYQLNKTILKGSTVR